MASDESATETPAVTDASDATRAPHRGFVIRAALVSSAAAIVLALAVGEYLTTRDSDKTPTTELASATRDPTTAPPTTQATTTTTIPPTTTTTIPPVQQFAALALPPPPGGSVQTGNRSDEIWGYEARMLQLHLDPGPVDGVFDAKTRFAVEAVQKQYGLARNGVIDQAVVDALTNFTYAPHVPTGEGDRVEIDLDKQVLTVYKGWQVALVTTTSTGNGKRFCGGSDGCQYAVTPPGKYAFTWNHRGWRQGKLGRLYNPWYFNGGIAIHGYSSVPTEPASHGCSRIPMHIAEYFGNLVYKDMTVYVLGTEAPRTGGGGGGGTPPPAPDTTAAPPVETTAAPPVETTIAPPVENTVAPVTAATAPPVPPVAVTTVVPAP